MKKKSEEKCFAGFNMSQQPKSPKIRKDFWHHKPGEEGKSMRDITNMEQNMVGQGQM